MQQYRLNKEAIVIYTIVTLTFNPYPVNVENSVSSYQCQQMADGI